MTDREKIRAEIIRLKEEDVGIGLCEYEAGRENGKYEFCDHMLAFIDDLPTEPSITCVYSEAYDTEVWEWLKEHGSEETKRIIMMTASHFAKWQKSHIKTELLQWLEAKRKEELLGHPTDVAAGRHTAYVIVAHKIKQL